VLARGVSEKIEIEAGPQPLDALMAEAEMKNHDLVEASTEGLTHKQVAKARRGRKLTTKLQRKLVAAWNKVQGESRKIGDLFNYKGR